MLVMMHAMDFASYNGWVIVMKGSYQLFEVVKRLREYMAGNPQKHEKIQVVFLLGFWQVWHAHRSLEPPKENIWQYL